MFETKESLDIEKKLQAFERRAEDKTPCSIHARELQYLDDKLGTVIGELKSASRSMESIAKGISNTVDSHRSEINSLATRVKDVEHVAKEITSQNKILLLFLAGAFSFIVLVGYDFFTHKKEVIEHIKEYNAKSNK